MLSLYIHIPFCDIKCDYCSFHVLPTDKMDDAPRMIQHYLGSLEQEIIQRSDRIGRESIQTIYIGGGTPTTLGVAGLCRVIDLLHERFDLEDLAELTIECNPEPESVIYDLVQTLAKQYRNIPRIRLSVGIQTLDNEILEASHRQYRFNQVAGFLRQLQKIRKPTISYNLDFIAFGKWRTLRDGTQELWREAERDFLDRLIGSQMADSFSVYTLELFPGSKRYADRIQHTTKPHAGHGLKQFGTDDEVYDEFSWYKEILLGHGYRRYELSNFSLLGKSSIHNRVYREMQSYLGLGSGASSFISPDYHQYDIIADYLETTDSSGLRRTNTKPIADYLRGDYIDKNSLIGLSTEDLLIEEFFLALRTDRGVQLHSDDTTNIYESIMVDNYSEIVLQLVEQGFVDAARWQDHSKIVLTDQGMDVYNDIVTSLLDRI